MACAKYSFDIETRKLHVKNFHKNGVGWEGKCFSLSFSHSLKFVFFRLCVFVVVSFVISLCFVSIFCSFYCLLCCFFFSFVLFFYLTFLIFLKIRCNLNYFKPILFNVWCLHHFAVVWAYCDENLLWTTL